MSNRDKVNEELLPHIKEAYKQSRNIYGYRNIHKDLLESGITVNKKRIARLMSASNMFGIGHHKKKPLHKASRPHKAHPNYLGQCFGVNEPNSVWVTDITYIKTYEGWLYLCVVLDLFSRKVVGWNTGHRMTTSLALNALKMATLRQRPGKSLMIHSDQGSQFSSYEWQALLKSHNVTQSMSRRGNCYDNAVAESFFKTFKRECVRKRTYITRWEAKSEIFHYIEMFYNPKRRHSYLGYISPIEFERRYNESIIKV
jgi:putative transposase